MKNAPETPKTPVQQFVEKLDPASRNEVIHECRNLATIVQSDGFDFDALVQKLLQLKSIVDGINKN